MDLLDALSAWPGAVALRQSALLYPLVNAAHILGIGLLLGAIVTLDLRLLGLFRDAPLGALAPPLVRVAGFGVLLAVVTGGLLFSVQPGAYAGNPAFLAKLVLVTLGLLNILALRRGQGWGRALAGGAVPIPVRAAALLSLALWLGAVLAGRWIAFLG